MFKFRINVNVALGTFHVFMSTLPLSPSCCDPRGCPRWTVSVGFSSLKFGVQFGYDGVLAGERKQGRKVKGFSPQLPLYQVSLSWPLSSTGS